MEDGNPDGPRVMLMAGEKVGLALMQAADVPILTRWNQDLDFTARIGMPGEAHTLEARQEFFQQNSRVRSDSVEFSVIELATDRLAGFGGLFDITRALVATMFVGIGEAQSRRQGFGTEACRLICEYGFFFKSLHSIKVEVHGYNHAARRVYERLGFKEAGRVRGAVLLNNRRYDDIIMDLLHSELELKHVGRFADLESGGE
jgi:RimJ/RimL family protein N-acetyltransferase